MISWPNSWFMLIYLLKKYLKMVKIEPWWLPWCDCRGRFTISGSPQQKNQVTSGRRWCHHVSHQNWLGYTWFLDQPMSKPCWLQTWKPVLFRWNPSFFMDGVSHHTWGSGWTCRTVKKPMMLKKNTRIWMVKPAFIHLLKKKDPQSSDSRHSVASPSVPPGNDGR